MRRRHEPLSCEALYRIRWHPITFPLKFLKQFRCTLLNRFVTFTRGKIIASPTDWSALDEYNGIYVVDSARFRNKEDV